MLSKSIGVKHKIHFTRKSIVLCILSAFLFYQDLPCFSFPRLQMCLQNLNHQLDIAK